MQLQRGRGGSAAQDEGELPGEVADADEARVIAEPPGRDEHVCGIPGEEDSVFAEATCAAGLIWRPTVTDAYRLLSRVVVRRRTLAPGINRGQWVSPRIGVEYSR